MRRCIRLLLAECNAFEEQIANSFPRLQVADLFFVHQRGFLNAIYLIAVTFGVRIGSCLCSFPTNAVQNYLAPVASGYVGSSQGWRWATWWTAIFTGIISLLMVFFLEETKYAPLIQGISVRTTNAAELLDALPDDDNKLNSDTKVGPLPDDNLKPTSPHKNSCRRTVPIDHSIPLASYRQRHRLISEKTHHDHALLRHYWQPFAILTTFPAIAFTAFQYGLAISCLSILATTQSTLYVQPPYLFSPIGVGNMNLAPAIGSILGALFGGVVVDRFILLAAKRNAGIYEPEMRLWLHLFPALTLSCGIFLYGLTIAKVC